MVLVRSNWFTMQTAPASAPSLLAVPKSKTKKKPPRTPSPLALPARSTANGSASARSGKKAGGKKTTAAKPQPELPLSSSRGDRFRAAGSGNGTHTGPSKTKIKGGRLSSLAETATSEMAAMPRQCTTFAASESTSRPLNACELDGLCAASSADYAPLRGMAAAEAAAREICEMAARQQPPWSCVIAERDNGEVYARVAVRAVLGEKALTLVAQVSQQAKAFEPAGAELKFFRRDGEELLSKIDTKVSPYSAEGLEECWEQSWID